MKRKNLSQAVREHSSSVELLCRARSLRHHGNSRLLHWLLLDHHWTLSRHQVGLHGHLLLLVEGRLALHLGRVVLGHGRFGVRLSRVRVALGQHEALSAWLFAVCTILEQFDVLLSGCEHEMLVVTLFLGKVLFDCLFGDFVLSISHLAQIGAPSGQAEAHDEVEESDVDD